MDQETRAQIALTSGESPRIELLGTIDVFLAGELLETAKRAVSAAGDLVVDCAKLDRLDTSALQVLLALEHALREQGRRTEIRAANDAVRAFFGFSGAGHLLLDAAPLQEAQPQKAEEESVSVSAAPVEVEDALDSGWQSDEVADDDAPPSDAPPLPDSKEETLTTELSDGEDE